MEKKYYVIIVENGDKWGCELPKKWFKGVDELYLNNSKQIILIKITPDLKKLKIRLHNKFVIYTLENRTETWIRPTFFRKCEEGFIYQLC